MAQGLRGQALWIYIHTLALQCEAALLPCRTSWACSIRRSEKSENRIQAEPHGPATSIVSTGSPPSRQGPVLDMSSTSAAPTLTALILSNELSDDAHRNGV